MNKILFLLFCVCSFQLQAGIISSDLRCFSSENKRIQLEFIAYEDSDAGWVGGRVRYKQSKVFIPLVFEKTEVLREIPGRAWEFKHTWLEVLNGEVNGKYEVVSQGANIYGFIYINKKSGKVSDISKSTHPNEKGICRW